MEKKNQDQSSLQDIVNSNPEMKNPKKIIKKKDTSNSEPSLVEVLEPKSSSLNNKIKAYTHDKEGFYTLLSILFLVGALFIHSLIFGILLTITGILLKPYNKRKTFIFMVLGIFSVMLFILPYVSNLNK
ncbi:hypothetical protein [Mycoplasma sp. P36-A1]|uniref:hypothetical protein n=1 Tax=Mycoplasma sp. P36-A1 TaxID=3252900 RepID=UPI003C2D55C5